MPPPATSVISKKSTTHGIARRHRRRSSIDWNVSTPSAVRTGLHDEVTVNYIVIVNDMDLGPRLGVNF